MDIQKPTLSQIDTLVKIVKEDRQLNKVFDTSNALELLRDITMRQKNFIYALIFNHKFNQLNQVMRNLGFFLKEPFDPEEAQSGHIADNYNEII